MRLYITAPSPFARKCRIVVREKGLQDKVEELVVDPYADDPELLKANPAAQAPALVAENGDVFTDSPLICAYLDSIGDGPRLIPESGDAHWRTRRLETLADLALEMGVKLVLEKRRPEHERSPSWMRRWTANMARTLDILEEWGPDPDAFDLGVLTTGVALTWIGFRHPDFDWKSGRGKLVELQAALEARPSFVATFPRTP